MTQTDSPSSLPSQLRSLLPLGLAALFMCAGMLVLVYLGRDRAAILNSTLDEIDLQPLLDTQEVPSVEIWKDEIIVLHFWGTWCPPCRTEYPAFARLSETYRANPELRFVSVSCSPGEESNLEELANVTRKYLEEIGVQMEIYADPAMYTRSRIAKLLSAGGFGYPTTLLIDQGGMIREVWRGKVPIPTMANAIDRHLSGNQSP